MENHSIEFPVSLTRDEYVVSQTVLTSAVRARRLGSTPWFGLVLVAVSLFGVVADWRVTGTWDARMLSALLLLLAVDIAMIIAMPRVQRYRGGLSYDQTLFTGYSFSGVIRADQNGIAKITKNGETTLPYLHCPLFVEHEECMIFCAEKSKSIVIPAAYLTAEDAGALRAFVFAAIPPSRRRLLSKLVPRLTQRLSPFEEAGAETTLLTVHSEMTVREMTDLFTDIFVAQLPAALPTKAAWASMIAMGGYLLFEVWPLPLFFLSLLLLILVPMFSVGFKVRRAEKQSDGEILNNVISFTDAAVHIRGAGVNEQHVRIPWARITRAVECPDRVELFAGHKFISIPKRCIADMEQLRTVVDSHYNH